jgi:PAS domain S-box-containing protein
MSRSDRLTQRVRRASVLSGLLAALIGGTALAGWTLEPPPGLHDLLAPRAGFPPSAALGLLLLGAGVALVAPDWRRPWIRRLALVPAAAAFALGVGGLVEGVAGVDLVLTGRLAAWQVLAAGRMASLTAVELLLGALALATLSIGRRRELLAAQILALAVLGVAGVALTGHLYGLHVLLQAVSQVAVVSLPSLVGWLAVALGLLFARPEVGVMRLVVDPTAGGASVRRLLPVTVVLVLLLGALRVWGEGRGVIPGALGSAIFAVTTVFLIGGLIVWNALRLREAERSLLREQESRNERQRQFRQAIIEAPIPILMFAEDGEVLEASRTVEEVTGYRPEEIPDLDAWGRLVAADDGGAAGAGAARELLAALGEFREVAVRTREGTTRTWRIRTSALGRLADDREAYVTMATDLTEIRRAEEQKDDFLAVLGHELRNPLAALSTGLELQRLRDDPQRRRAIVAMMRRQVEHLARLLDDLLDVSRISRGKITLQTEVVSLNDALERAVEEHRGVLPGHRSPRISLTMPPRAIPVAADPTRLHQILSNLLGNAVKYTPPDGRIWVALEREETEAVVRVRDTGIGLEQAELDTIFEPFRQLDHKGGELRGGLGLGLTLVRRLALLHGGNVAAASRGSGRGSTFTLRLPAAAEELLAARRPEVTGERPAEEAEAAGPLRVLVVDDQRELADGLAELLTLSGYETATAYDGKEALELSRRLPPDVVLLDLDLPDLDGYAVAHRIRDRQADQPLLVAISGFGGERHKQRSREAGIDRHLVKPVDIDQVLELLRGVVAPGAPV